MLTNLLGRTPGRTHARTDRRTTRKQNALEICILQLELKSHQIVCTKHQSDKLSSFVLLFPYIKVLQKGLYVTGRHYRAMPRQTYSVRLFVKMANKIFK